MVLRKCGGDCFNKANGLNGRECGKHGRLTPRLVGLPLCVMASGDGASGDETKGTAVIVIVPVKH